MKKLFMLLAIAGVMVACADDKKKDEKKDAQATEAPAPAADEVEVEVEDIQDDVEDFE